MDAALAHSEMELDNVLHTFIQFKGRFVLAHTITLNRELLIVGIEGKADQTSLPVCSFNLIDGRSEVTIVGEGPIAKLRRNSSIGHGKAKRVNVGVYTPLQSREPKVFELSLQFALEVVFVRESADVLILFTTEEVRETKHCWSHIFNIDSCKELCEILDVVQLAMVETHELLAIQGLTRLKNLI